MSAPISSPFLICMIPASIFMLCKLIWDCLFWLHFGPSALFCVSIESQIPKLTYLGSRLFTSPHLYDLVNILIHCKWLWDRSFWLHFGCSALFCVSIVSQIPKLTYLGSHLFTIPHLYDLVSILMHCKRFWDCLFWLHFGPSSLFCVLIVP